MGLKANCFQSRNCMPGSVDESKGMRAPGAKPSREVQKEPTDRKLMNVGLAKHRTSAEGLYYFSPGLRAGALFPPAESMCTGGECRLPFGSRLEPA